MNCAIHRITRRSTSEAAEEKCHLAQSWFTADANSSPRTDAWFPPELIYPKKRGSQISRGIPKNVVLHLPQDASIGWGSSGNGSSNSEAISMRLFAEVTRVRSNRPYSRTTSSDAFSKSSRKVPKSESRPVPSVEVCFVIWEPWIVSMPYKILMLQLASLGRYCCLISCTGWADQSLSSKSSLARSGALVRNGIYLCICQGPRERTCNARQRSS
jgi:hypothetical protein